MEGVQCPEGSETFRGTRIHLLGGRSWRGIKKGEPAWQSGGGKSNLKGGGACKKKSSEAPTECTVLVLCVRGMNRFVTFARGR